MFNPSDNNRLRGGANFIQTGEAMNEQERKELEAQAAQIIEDKRKTFNARLTDLAAVLNQNTENLSKTRVQLNTQRDLASDRRINLKTGFPPDLDIKLAEDVLKDATSVIFELLFATKQ